MSMDTNLVNAIKAGDLAAVKTALAASVQVNGTSENGSTALMWACKLGNTDIVAALLEAGADVSLATEKGATALGIAAKNDHVRVVKMLLAAGASIDAESYQAVLEQGNIELLIEYGKANTQKQALAAKFRETFGFLCETGEERDLLEAMSYLVDSMEQLPDGGLKVRVGDDLIECQPAFQGKPQDWVPQSYGAIARHFNEIVWESIGGGGIGFGGLDDNGNPQYDWGWDSSYLEEGGEERDDLGEAYAAFGCGQNWLLFDPVNTNHRGEAALGFVSHESCIWEPVESADPLLYGGVLLRLMANYFINYDFDGVYN